MAKKEKIQLQHSDELESVDAELASAMELLDQANERVDGLLRSIDISVTSGQSELFSAGDSAASPPCSNVAESGPDESCSGE